MPRGNPNIKPRWKKGESGNPAGLPKGYVRASTQLNKFLKAKVEVRVRNKVVKKVASEVIALKGIRDAIDEKNTASERTQARESIYSRIEGKPVQPLGAAPDTEVSLIIKGKEAEL